MHPHQRHASLYHKTQETYSPVGRRNRLIYWSWDQSTGADIKKYFTGTRVNKMILECEHACYTDSCLPVGVLLEHLEGDFVVLHCSAWRSLVFVEEPSQHDVVNTSYAPFNWVETTTQGWFGLDKISTESDKELKHWRGHKAEDWEWVEVWDILINVWSDGWISDVNVARVCPLECWWMKRVCRKTELVLVLVSVSVSVSVSLGCV